MIFARWFLSMSEWSREELELCACFLQTLFKFPMRSCLKYLVLFFSFPKREIGVFAYWKQPHLQGLTRFKSKRQRKRKQRKVLLWRPRKQMFIRAQTHGWWSPCAYLNELSSEHTVKSNFEGSKDIHWRISQIAETWIWIWWQKQRGRKEHQISLSVISNPICMLRYNLFF